MILRHTGCAKNKKMKLLKIYKRALDLLGSDKKQGWYLAIANVALAMALFAEPVLFGRVIDTLSQGSSEQSADLWNKVWPLLAAWTGFGIFTILSSTLISLYSDRLAHRRRHAAVSTYFEHVLELPLAQQNSTHSGRLMKIMLQGTDALWWLWLSFFREHLAALVSLLVLIPLALYMNWRLAIVLIILCTVFAFLTNFIIRKTQTLQQQVESHHSDMAEQVSDTLGNIPLVQSFARIQDEVSALKNISNRLLSVQLPVLSWWALVTVLNRSATTISILSIIIIGTWLFTKGLISIGAIVTFIAFAGMIITKLEQSVNFFHRLAMDAPRLSDFFKMLDTSPEIYDRSNALTLSHVKGELEFKNVSFSYDGKHQALKDLNFTVAAGQTVALVGSSGAGKSTALSLLYRAFDPQAGVISIDGTDIKDISLASLRHHIGVVFQEPLLFNRSIAENLLVGQPEATESDLKAAARSAQALDFIEQQEKGFETKIGERGRTLSGGERQRISIARVILKNPPILILDEATSALDSSTEKKLTLALEAVIKNRTTLIIAHRLSTIRRADKILVMDSGQVIEAGTYDELNAQGGRFAQLVREQFTELPLKAAP